MDSNFNFLDRIIARLRLRQISGFLEKGDEVLDFGCGRRSYLLESQRDKINFGVGVDSKVFGRKDKNISYLQYRFDKKLPFDNGFFNKIFLLAVLEHIDEKQVKILFSEFKRILKTEGSIILTTPTPKSRWWLELLAFRLKLISAQEIADHKKYYQRSDLSGLARETGFKMINYKFFQLGLNSYAVFKKIA